MRLVIKVFHVKQFCQYTGEIGVLREKAGESV